MLEVRRTGFSSEGNPIRVTVTVYPGDRNQFELEAGEVPQGEMKAVMSPRPKRKPRRIYRLRPANRRFDRIIERTGRRRGEGSRANHCGHSVVTSTTHFCGSKFELHT